jgi:hypothetical protein
MKSIDSTNSLTVFLDGKPNTFRNDHPLFNELVAAVEDNDEQEVRNLMKQGIAAVVNRKVSSQDGFSVTADGVSWKGVQLHGVLVDKIRELVKKGAKNLDNYVAFLEKLYQNPSKRSVEQLFQFLSHKLLPITESGNFIAYKGTGSEGWSISGNTQTVVLKGKTDERGRIFNGVGEEIEVARNQVDDNPEHHCSFGLHAGSWDYASSFGHGRVCVVEINPKDVVSVPKDCGCQKARVCAYTVVEEVKSELNSAGVDTSTGTCESTDGPSSQKVALKVLGYLSRKPSGATLKMVQSAMKGESLTCREIEKIVRDNGGTVKYGKCLSESVATYSE